MTNTINLWKTIGREFHNWISKQLIERMIKNKWAVIEIRHWFPEVPRVGLKTKNFKSYSAITIFSLLFFSKSSLSIFLNPFSCCTSPPFIGTFPFLLSSAGLLPARFRGYLSHHPSTLPSFHHEIRFLGHLYCSG